MDLATLEGGVSNERWEKHPKTLGIRGTTNMTTFSHPYEKRFSSDSISAINFHGSGHYHTFMFCKESQGFIPKPSARPTY